MTRARSVAGTRTRPVSTTALAMAGRQFDYWATVYRRTWRGSIVSSFVTPLLYVAALGVLLGRYVDAAVPSGRLDGAAGYLQFVAPGMLAGQSMMLAIGETTYPVMGMIKWSRTYDAMLATPLTVPDIVTAQFAYILWRIASADAVFMLALAPFGVYADAPGALCAYLVQLVIGAAFAGVVFAFSAASQNESNFSIIYRVIQVPLFLFSGSFFPITNLAEPLQWAARATPLWHGVELTRMLTLGRPDWPAALGHLAYLIVLAVVGAILTVRLLRRRLVS